MKRFNALILAVTTLFMAQANADLDAQAAKIQERIKPVGEVCVGAECGGVAVVASEPRSGEDVYGAACSACHNTGILNAPKKGDKAAWDTRLAKGLDVTLSNAIKGINAMPPKGNCATCSDDEILNAIKYMAEID